MPQPVTLRRSVGPLRHQIGMKPDTPILDWRSPQLQEAGRGLSTGYAIFCAQGGGNTAILACLRPHRRQRNLRDTPFSGPFPSAFAAEVALSVRAFPQ
jgi:hypothetical protein